MLGFLCNHFEKNVQLTEDSEDDEIGVLEDMRYLRRVGNVQNLLENFKVLCAIDTPTAHTLRKPFFIGHNPLKMAEEA